MPRASVSGNEPFTASSQTPGKKTPRLKSPVDCWQTNEIASKHFHVSLDRSVRTKGNASGSISVDQEQPFPAQLLQTVDASALRGKRVEFTADVRSRLAARTAGLRIRVYDAQGRLIAVEHQLLTVPEGATSNDADWTTLDVALDVPANARAASYELIQRGVGQSWIDNAHVEVSDSTAGAPGEALSAPRFLPEWADIASTPTNLDFEPDAASTCN